MPPSYWRALPSQVVKGGIQHAHPPVQINRLQTPAFKHQVAQMNRVTPQDLNPVLKQRLPQFGLSTLDADTFESATDAQSLLDQDQWFQLQQHLRHIPESTIARQKELELEENLWAWVIEIGFFVVTSLIGAFRSGLKGSVPVGADWEDNHLLIQQMLRGLPDHLDKSP